MLAVLRFSTSRSLSTRALELYRSFCLVTVRGILFQVLYSSPQDSQGTKLGGPSWSGGFQDVVAPFRCPSPRCREWMHRYFYPSWRESRTFIISRSFISSYRRRICHGGRMLQWTLQLPGPPNIRKVEISTCVPAFAAELNGAIADQGIMHVDLT